MSEDAAATEKLWTVSEVNRLVKDVLEQSFYPFWIRGELSNLMVARSGHVYFTLKDDRSQLASVFFRGAAEVQQLQIQDGKAVEAWGRLSVYEPRGTYQFVVNRLRSIGIGDLQQQFNLLKARLQAEGLFDAERKRPIPAMPRCIGVVTSADGAAIRDFLQVIGRRFADVHIRVVPVLVQGRTAAAEVSAALRWLNTENACDVIVLTRGGGSLEDLWPFNEEVLARAVAASTIPVISAIGHEIDFTICDFVADLRVPTPSAAAELVIAAKSEILARLNNLQQRLQTQMQMQMRDLRFRVDRAVNSRVFQEPAHAVQSYQQRLDELGMRLHAAVERQLDTARHKHAQLGGRLQALNPHCVLERGYSILIDSQTNQAVTTAEQAPVGRQLRAMLAHGQLQLTVEQSSMPPE